MKNNAVGTNPSSKPCGRVLTAVAAAANLYAELASANLSPAVRKTNISAAAASGGLQRSITQ